MGLIEMLDRKRDFLREKYDFDFRLVFVNDAVKGTVFSETGLDTAEILREIAARGGLPESRSAGTGPGGLTDLLRATRPDIVCEAAPTDYKTGEPGMTILSSALKAGASAVTSSKGAVGLRMAELKKLAEENGVYLRFESSVLSGTPLINLARGPLAGCSLSKVEGIVNGTTNYILTAMEGGMSYGEALKEAQRLGYAEADPAGDVEGFDAAVKVCIMSAEFFGTALSVDEVSRTGITGVTEADVASAAKSGGRIKLIAGVSRAGESVRGYVEPRAVDLTNPLASVSGAMNAVSITTDNLGEITISGPGAGKKETAQGLLSDILDIVSMRCLTVR
jgi:homoserine dehydrogenase